MKRFLISFVSLLSALFSSLYSCSKSPPSSSIVSASVPTEIQRDYSEIKEWEISWESVFILAKPGYFVYFYSRECSHCASIKNQIIEYALANPDTMYFVGDSKKVVFGENVKTTIDCSRIEDFFIAGYPTLAVISEAKCVQNIPGAKPILSYLKI